MYNLTEVKKELRGLLEQYSEGLITKDELRMKALDVLIDADHDALLKILEVIC